MKLTNAIAAVAAIALVAGPAHALDIANDDDQTYQVEILLGEGDGGTQSFELVSGEGLQDICEAGCKIRLNNGVEKEFAGDEIVVIRDGQFVTAE